MLDLVHLITIKLGIKIEFFVILILDYHNISLSKFDSGIDLEYHKKILSLFDKKEPK